MSDWHRRDDGTDAIWLAELGWKEAAAGKLNLKGEQMILMNVADMMIDAYLAESTLLRVRKLATLESGRKHDISVYADMLRLFINDAQARIAKSAGDALASFAEGDVLKTLNMGVKRFSKYPSPQVRDARKRIADIQLEANAYAF